MTTPSRIAKLRTSSPELARVQDNVARTLEPVAAAVLRTPLGGGPKPSWKLIDAMAGWTSGAGVIVKGALHVDALGYVHGRGAFTNSSGAGSVAQMVALPIGMRPSGNEVIAVAGGGGTSQQYLIITPAGVVSPGNSVANGDWIGFSFSFLAEQ